MRVIAGDLRSRRIAGISGDATRPTSDRLRETLFDILASRIRGATFLDAYAGTGAVGIEALSRGAAHAWFLERSRAALQVLRQNLASLDLEARSSVIAGPRCCPSRALPPPSCFSTRPTRSIANYPPRSTCWQPRPRRWSSRSIPSACPSARPSACCAAPASSNRVTTP